MAPRGATSRIWKASPRRAFGICANSALSAPNKSLGHAYILLQHSLKEDAMNDQERQVIDDIFQRLEQVANQPREPEAERYIAEKLRRQPYAPYALAQAVFVQEQALANLQADNESLRAELDRVSR